MKTVFFIIGLLMTMQAQADMTGGVDFKTLSVPKTPNYYLVCPKAYCQAEPQMLSPVYPVDTNTLYEKWTAVVTKQPRTKLVWSDSQKGQYQYVQRSFIFRFPDYINVQLIALGNKQSTIAIFSRSRYGHSDFGVNEKRVRRWLGALNQLIRPSEHQSDNVNNVKQ